MNSVTVTSVGTHFIVENNESPRSVLCARAIVRIFFTSFSTLIPLLKWLGQRN